MEMHDEIRVEIQAGELLKFFKEDYVIADDYYKLNNVFVSGKDIGPNGWITFVLRKREVKPGATTNQD